MSKKLPEGWRRLSLSELGKIYTGNTPPTKKEEFYISNDVMFIKPDDFIQGKINIIGKSKAYLSKVGAEKGRFIPKGSVLITCIGILGKVGIIDEDCCFNQQINAIVPNLNIVIPKYVAYYIMNNKHILESMAGGAVVPMINKTQFSSIKIDLPQLEEQERIVSILEKAENAIEKREESITLLDEYLKSVFVDMFGNLESNKNEFKIKDLEEVMERIVDCPHSTPRYSDCITPYPCIRSSEIKNGYIDWDTMKYLDKSSFEERISRIKPMCGDLIYVREGNYGDLVIVPENINISLGQRVVLFRPNKTMCNSMFLWGQIKSDSFVRQTKAKNCGTTVGRINVKDIKKLKIMVPPIETQNKFADLVKQIDNIKNKMEDSLDELKNNFNSLIQKAFNGEL